MTLKVAVVGMGGIGNNHARIYGEHPDTEVVAVLRYYTRALRQSGRSAWLSGAFILCRTCLIAAWHLIWPV